MDKSNLDRSSVRETYLRQSYVLNGGGNTQQTRSFINTSLISDSVAYGDDLRKSRIQNLPNYKKSNLGDNLQFIVVFQTIQIQRLSSQVEVLRVKLKQSQRQLFNAQNYEVQIRELTEKCFALESEREEYRIEIDKLGKICETLYHENQMLKNRLHDEDYSLKQKFQSEKQKNSDLMQEIDKWKARYQATERSKAKELEDLRNLMDCQRKSMIDREIRQVTIRFQNQRAGLENQIRKNREMLENRNREIEDYRQKCQKFEISLMELRNYENVIADNENKIVLLNQQLLRLNEVLKQKQQQIHGYKQRQFKLNQQLKEQQQWEYQNKQLKTTLDNRIKEIDEWKARNSRLEMEAERAKEMIHYNEQLSNKLQVSAREIERLNNVLRTKLDEIQQWKKRVSDKEMEISKFKHLENDLSNYQSRYNMLQAENERINKVLKSRQSEIEDWKTKAGTLQSNIDNFGIIERDKKKLEDQFNGQVKANEEMQFVLKKMEKDISSYRDYESQCRDFERQNSALGKEIERLNNIIRNNSHEVDDYRTRISRLQVNINEYKNIELRVKEFENKIAMLVQENERLNGLIRTKNDDIEQLEKDKLQLHTEMMKYKNYEHKITENEQIVSRLNDQLSNIKREKDRALEKNDQTDGRVRQLQNHLFMNNQEKEKLSSMLKSKGNEYDDLRGKHARLQNDVRKISELQLVCQEQHNQIMAYIADIEGFERNVKDYEVELERERQVSNEFAYKIIVLSCEIERLAGAGAGGANSTVKAREFQELQDNYSRLQTKMVSKNNEIDILLSKVSSLESKISELSSQFSRLLSEAQRNENETLMLVQKIEEYQDYAKRIHILGAEIDRLRAENKAFDEDARRIRLKFSDGLAHEKKQEDFNFLTVLMAIEIQSLRSKVDEREINIDEMRKSILEPVRRI